MKPITETQEAICAASMEDSTLLRRIICLMPGGRPTLDFLEMLYAYAELRNRKAVLANALLGQNCGIMPRSGRGWYDWFLEIHLPEKAPDFLFLVWKYGWIMAKLESGGFAAEENAESAIGAVEMLMEETGPDLFGAADVLRKLHEIDERQIAEENARVEQSFSAQKEGR